jgi:Uma2 family endonuclease
MPATAPQLNRKYTYADYLTWPDDQRWELIHGEPCATSPAPRPRHQRVVRNLTRMIDTHLLGQPCEVFAAPFDVRFARSGETPDEETDTTVQPDLSVICDSNKIDDRGCAGAPDLIVEVLSEATAGRDEETKFFLYQEHGVREYWVVNPWDETFRIYTLNDSGHYSFPRLVTRDETAESTAIEGLTIFLGDVFETPGEAPERQ